MPNRTEALRHLLEYSKPIDELRNELSQFEWDCESPLIVLRTNHLKNVLSRYFTGELSAQDIEDWANLIEVREDIDFDSGHRGVIESVIYELANPCLAGSLTKERAAGLSAQLGDWEI